MRPACSRHALPEAFQDLMVQKDSPIIDFYPEDIKQDPNGKRFPWQWVVLLPFIDETRLTAAVESVKVRSVLSACMAAALLCVWAVISRPCI